MCDVFIFRRVSIVAKKHLLASPCPFVCPHASVPLQLDGFQRNLTLGTLRNSVEETEILLKLGKNIGRFT